MVVVVVDQVLVVVVVEVGVVEDLDIDYLHNIDYEIEDMEVESYTHFVDVVACELGLVPGLELELEVELVVELFLLLFHFFSLDRSINNLLSRLSLVK